MVERFHESCLHAVFQTLKRDGVGAARIVFHETATKQQSKNLARIEDVFEEFCLKFDFTTSAEKSALLYLLGLCRVEGTEQADYNKYAAMIKKSCPPMPPGDRPFLPFLTFVTAPPRGQLRKSCEPGRANDSARGITKDLSHAHNAKFVEAPPSPRAQPTQQLANALQREGHGAKTATLQQYSRAMRQLDHTVDPSEVKSLFQISAGSGASARGAKGTAPVEELISVTAPHMALVRQKTSSSALIKDALTWSAKPKGQSAFSPPPTPRKTRDPAASPRNAAQAADQS